MEIAIVGAGLGGLAAAFVFAKDGHKVHVFEQRSALSDKGSGLMIRPSASRILISWGLEKDFSDVSDLSPAVYLRDLHTNRINMRNIAVDVSEAPDWGIERRVLQDLFYRNAVKVGAKIEFQTVVEDIGDDEHGAWITFQGGRTQKADLVLAADGVRSRMRRKVLSDVTSSIDPILANITLSGTTVPISEMKNDSDAAVLCEETNLMVWGGRQGFAVGRLHKKTGVWSGLYGMKQTDQDSSKRLWDEEGDIHHVRAHFHDACAPLKAAMQLAKTCDRWKLCEMPVLPRWSSKNGKILLLGDSAHAMHPNAAQGFSTIIEDIGVLRCVLERYQNVVTREAVMAWEQIRMPRVERIKAYARWNTGMFTGDTDTPTANNDRNNVKSLKHVSPNMNAKFHSSAFVKWAHDFDAVGEAKEYLDKNGPDQARL